jgi:hypothetical protein
MQIQLALFLGVKASELPIVVGVKSDPNNLKKPPAAFKYTGSLSDVDQLTQFVTDFKLDNLKKTLKSQDVPTSNNDPIKRIVGSTYHKETNDPDRDVLINLCAPLHDDCI